MPEPSVSDVMEAPTMVTQDAVEETSADSDNEDTLSYFAKLAKESLVINKSQ